MPGLLAALGVRRPLPRHCSDMWFGEPAHLGDGWSRVAPQARYSERRVPAATRLATRKRHAFARELIGFNGTCWDAAFHYLCSSRALLGTLENSEAPLDHKKTGLRRLPVHVAPAASFPAHPRRGGRRFDAGVDEAVRAHLGTPVWRNTHGSPMRACAGIRPTAIRQHGGVPVAEQRAKP